jgi:hypothetical protein
MSVTATKRRWEGTGSWTCWRHRRGGMVFAVRHRARHARRRAVNGVARPLVFKGDRAHRSSPGVLIESPHLVWGVHRQSGAVRSRVRAAAFMYQRCIRSSDTAWCWLVASRPSRVAKALVDGTNRSGRARAGHAEFGLRIKRLDVRVIPSALSRSPDLAGLAWSAIGTGHRRSVARRTRISAVRRFSGSTSSGACPRQRQHERHGREQQPLMRALSKLRHEVGVEEVHQSIGLTLAAHDRPALRTRCPRRRLGSVRRFCARRRRLSGSLLADVTPAVLCSFPDVVRPELSAERSAARR